jgi:hypothetical protein
MTPGRARLAPLRLAAWLTGLALAAPLLLQAAPQGNAPASPAPLRNAAPAADSPEWLRLSPAHRQALAPLAPDWAGMAPPQRQKWIELAERMPSMPAQERQRIQERMAEWARLTPVERGQARLRYLQARREAPDDRHARWEAYQALPSEQKEKLAAKAATPASAPGSTRQAVAERGARIDKAEARGLAEKSNVVTNPNFVAAPRAVAPTVIQARPGATTTLVSRPPSPPRHQQTGLPKIAASPGFVDKDTLLPQRGPQGAATISVHALDLDEEPAPRP